MTRYGQMIRVRADRLEEYRRYHAEVWPGILDLIRRCNIMFFSPDYWRRCCKPGLRAMVETCHEHDLPVIYHGCGNVSRVFEDFIEVGVDAYNPLEAKAGLDVVELRRRYGHRIGFCGNMNVIEWASCSQEELKAIVLRN